MRITGDTNEMVIGKAKLDRGTSLLISEHTGIMNDAGERSTVVRECVNKARKIQL